MEALIELDNVGLAFERDGERTDVLRGVDLKIGPGEFVAIVGIRRRQVDAAAAADQSRATQ